MSPSQHQRGKKQFLLFVAPAKRSFIFGFSQPFRVALQVRKVLSKNYSVEKCSCAFTSGFCFLPPTLVLVLWSSAKNVKYFFRLWNYHKQGKTTTTTNNHQYNFVAMDTMTLFSLTVVTFDVFPGPQKPKQSIWPHGVYMLLKPAYPPWWTWLWPCRYTTVDRCEQLDAPKACVSTVMDLAVAM